MKPKKNPKADLEKRKFFFFQIGLVVALLFVLAAFSYKSYSKRELADFQREVQDVPEEIIPITEQEEKPPPPPPPPPQAVVLDVVDDDQEVDNDIQIDVEANQETVIDSPVQVEQEEEETGEQEIFSVVEQQPEFPGGTAALLNYLGRNIRYPVMAKEAGIQGRVFLTFVVEPDGSISGIKVLRGIGGGCDEEAVRVVRNMPKWAPGKQRGQPVRVQFNLPVKFTLQ